MNKCIFKNPPKGQQEEMKESGQGVLWGVDGSLAHKDGVQGATPHP